MKKKENLSDFECSWLVVPGGLILEPANQLGFSPATISRVYREQSQTGEISYEAVVLIKMMLVLEERGRLVLMERQQYVKKPLVTTEECKILSLEL